MLLLKVPLLVWEMNIILQDNKKKTDSSCFIISVLNKKLFEETNVAIEIRQGLKKQKQTNCQTPGARESAHDEQARSVSAGNVSLFISSLRAGRYRGMAALQGQYFTLTCAL